MPVSRQTKKAWEKRFERVNQERTKANEDWLVLIYEGRQEGLSQADVAYMAEDVSPSGIPAKEAQGKALAEARRGKRGTGTP